MKNFCYIALFALAVGVLAVPSDAQGSNCGGLVNMGAGWNPASNPPDSPYYNCFYAGAGEPGWSGPSWFCYKRANCPPPTVVCLSCLAAAGSAGHPISLATGDTFIEENDIKIPGIGGGLNLNRTWNSILPSVQGSAQSGVFGGNWRSTFEERVFTSGDGYMMYSRGDGSFWAFYYSGAPGWNNAAPANVSASLVQGTSTWTLTFQNGEKRLFDVNSGNLTGIVDRNGNTTQVSYDATGRLATVTDPALRHLYFGYANNTSTLVTNVTSDIGIALSYAYDSQGRLTLVTKPDSTTISFQYNSQSLVTAVLDSSGKVLESHSYDSLGRGLTSSRAGGVDSVTVTYPN
jgi:YD repeat-containing protein